MPLFKRAPAADAEGFVATVPAIAVTEDEMTTVRVAGKKVILTRRAGRLYAIDSACPGATMTWSSTRTSTSASAAFSVCVSASSARLGSTPGSARV